ncbi:hypothetical protein BH10CYA1_BH10CYA1_27240 [soil metagenome]
MSMRRLNNNQLTVSGAVSGPLRGAFRSGLEALLVQSGGHSDPG